MRASIERNYILEYFVAVEDPILRTRLRRVLRSLEIEPAVTGDAKEAYRVNPLRLKQDLLLLETGNNVHRLTQTVNDLHYSPWHEGGPVPVICFVSRRTLKENPTLGFWLIAGSAAVGAVWTTDMSDTEMASTFRYLNAHRPDDLAVPEQPQFAEAVAAISAAPTEAASWLGLAEILAEHREVQEVRRELAEALLRKALSLDPHSARAHMRLAKVLSWRGQHSAAVDECQLAIRLDPENAEAHYQLGSILSLNDNPDEARLYLIRAIELAGSSPVGTWAKNILSSIERQAGE